MLRDASRDYSEIIIWPCAPCCCAHAACHSLTHLSTSNKATLSLLPLYIAILLILARNPIGPRLDLDRNPIGPRLDLYQTSRASLQDPIRARLQG